MRKWVGCIMLIRGTDEVHAIWEFDSHRQYRRYTNESESMLRHIQTEHPAEDVKLREFFGNWRKMAEKQPKEISEIAEKVVDS